MNPKHLPILLVFLAATATLTAQDTRPKKYPSLLWEITGNGLKEASYLFGTMHVSSKMVFHLSDSFYNCIRNSEMVALELDPAVWQTEMVRMQKMETNLRYFSQQLPRQYLNEKSFQLRSYEERIQEALSDVPYVINSLLYRSYQDQADFEEDTYLDLYIYQTGKKLGKLTTGVENYYETEKLIIEAYQDMAQEKKKKTASSYMEAPYEIEKKAQEAYRKGDLDLLDSLERILQSSEAFMEKFLYLRNEIQANSIDTILRKHSLFVGVGAAHLPGERGVIELLRRKGYQLRPIVMQDRDAEEKERIDKMRVKVDFQSYTADDGLFSVMVPGPLYRKEENMVNQGFQFADMSNGSYYMVNRVRTNAPVFGHTEATVVKKIDSLLYENIPGRIIKRTSISRNGYPGFDITNRTRRGDIQRYHIFVLPFDILVFKMSGIDDYVQGEEAETFFNSIQLAPAMSESGQNYEPPQGGFRINFPTKPSVISNLDAEDYLNVWEYASYDKKSGNAYALWKKNVYNFDFIEEDSFDLSLMHESFKRANIIQKELYRKTGKTNQYNYLEVKHQLKDGTFITGRFILKGAHYYMLLMHSKQKDASADQFFNSFSLTTLKYRPAVLYYDTLLNFQVNTPVVPVLDEEIRALVEKSSSEEFLNGIPDYYSYYPRNRYAAFESDSTGESIYVTIHTFPKYYHAEDSASFWGQQLNLKRIGKNFIIKKNEFFRKSDSICGYRLELTDTNSTRIIHGMVMLRDNRLFTVMTLGDSTAEMSSFVKGFFESFQPLSRKTGPSVFQNKTNAFFNDYYSTDSLTRKRAKDAINYVHFGKEGLPKLLQAIKSLKYGDKDYFDNKTRFIAELGYIKDSTVVNQVLNELKAIHEASFDTSSFQNAAITAIANLNTEKSYKVLKELLLLEPPVFEDSEDYSELFENITDSLQLSRILLPELFQLASIDDYKELINSMLRDLVDSSLVSGADYDSYFPKLFFDARIEWKKQQVRDEKMLDKQVNDDDDQEAYMYGLSFGNKSSSSDLESYAVLLLPFYESKLQVQKYFERLLTSTDGGLQLFTVIRMLKQKLAVPDSIIKSVASKDEYRGRLLAELEEIGQTDKFPAEFRKQEDVARSMLLRGSRFQKFYAIELFDKIRLNHKNKTGYVYLFKYKLMKDDDWMIGISGLQPLDTRMVSGKGELVKLTGVHLNGPDPVSDQFMEQVKRLQFSKRRSAEYFFNSRY